MPNYRKIKRENYYGDSSHVALYARALRDNNHPHSDIAGHLSTAMTIIASEPNQALQTLIDLKAEVEKKIIDIKRDLGKI